MNRNKLILAFSCVAFIIVCFVFIYFLGEQKTSALRLPDKYKMSADDTLGKKEEKLVQKYISTIDKDADGIDDQTDILENVISYINTEPKYKSRYYDTGYPDDGYGVCTDVVAFALLGAGYDLKLLVQQDISAKSAEYGIEKPDENIDFRRVKNLKIFFEHTAIPLTTDINAVEEWQGGDIVIFKKHIGIVSDRRNERGVPYIIHHDSPRQKRYEQDILEQRKDIVGHYRIS